MESMRATWTDTRLDEFATNVDRRFDGVEKHLGKLDFRLEAVDLRFDEVNRNLSKVDVDIREMKSEIAANSRAMLQFCGVMVAAQMATVATLIALFG
jgi:hypothetical protein